MQRLLVLVEQLGDVTQRLLVLVEQLGDVMQRSLVLVEQLSDIQQTGAGDGAQEVKHVTKLEVAIELRQRQLVDEATSRHLEPDAVRLLPVLG